MFQLNNKNKHLLEMPTVGKTNPLQRIRYKKETWPAIATQHEASINSKLKDKRRSGTKTLLMPLASHSMLAIHTTQRPLHEKDLRH